jgi:hypothetical protein
MTGPAPFPANNAQWQQYPQYPVPPTAQHQGYWASGQGGPPFPGNTQPYGYSYPTTGAGGGPPGGGGPSRYPQAYLYGPPPAWYQPALGAQPSQPTKVFQPFKTKLFKGMKGEKGAKARRFVKTMEMYRDSTPGMTEGQMGVTMYTNMDDSAKDWVHAEDEEYKRQNGGMSLLHN